MDRALRRALAAAVLVHAVALAWAPSDAIHAWLVRATEARDEADARTVQTFLLDEPVPDPLAEDERALAALPRSEGAPAVDVLPAVPGPRALAAPRAPAAMGAARPAPATVERLTSPAAPASGEVIATAPGPKVEGGRPAASADAQGALDARLDAFDPNRRPSWMPAKIGAGARPDDGTNVAKAEARLSRELAQGVDAKGRLGAGGAGYGGPVVSAAHDASMGLWAPDTGYAVIAVDFDDKGAVSRVSLVDASGSREGWQKVAGGIEKGLATKKLDLPKGAAGLRVTVKVEAKLALPSGATDRVSGPTIGTDGNQATASVSFDLSDVGQKPRRMVGVVVLSETRL